MEKKTIAARVISYYSDLLNRIWDYFNPKDQDSCLYLARFLRSRDENFAVEVLRGLSNYDHSMAFSTCIDFTKEGKRRHRELQMKYFKIALDFCFLVGIEAPKPHWRVLRAFPDLRLLTTKKGRLAYALGKRMYGNKNDSKSDEKIQRSVVHAIRPWKPRDSLKKKTLCGISIMNKNNLEVSAFVHQVSCKKCQRISKT